MVATRPFDNAWPPGTKGRVPTSLAISACWTCAVLRHGERSRFQLLFKLAGAVTAGSTVWLFKLAVAVYPIVLKVLHRESQGSVLEVRGRPGPWHVCNIALAKTHA